ncbi:MAG: hypothetical protein ABIA74_03035 [bacterium]
MIGQPLWKSLKALVEIDNEAKKIKEKILGGNQNIEEKKLLIPKIQKEIQVLELKCKETKKMVDEEELIANDLKEKEDEKRVALDKTKNEKEYRAVEKEIKKITQDRMELEDILIQSWHKHDQAKKLLDEESKNKNQKIEDIKKEIIDHEINLKELNLKLKEVEEKRKNAIDNIPDEWLQKYNRMKEHVTNPIVPVMQNCCSACYYSVIRQDLQRLKKSGVLLCRNCYRFLYYDEEEEIEETNNSY